MDGGEGGSLDFGAPGAMDGPEGRPGPKGSGDRSDLAAFAISCFLGLVMAFLAGAWSGSQGTVSKEGLRQAIAEISMRCGK